MQDKDNWRWEDLDTAFDKDFVEKAQFREGDWKERKQQRTDAERGAKREAKKRTSPVRGTREEDKERQPISRAPLTTRARLNRIAIIVVVLAAIIVGLGFDGHGPLSFLRGGPPLDPPTTTSTTVAPTTSVQTTVTPTSTVPVRGDGDPEPNQSRSAPSTVTSSVTTTR